MTAYRQIFSTKPPADARRLTFEFAQDLNPGETLVTVTPVVTVWSGADPTPAALITASAPSGTQVIATASGGVDGTIYSIVMTVLTSLSQSLSRTGHLLVSSDSL